jgi:hypothetical protein
MIWKKIDTEMILNCTSLKKGNTSSINLKAMVNGYLKITINMKGTLKKTCSMERVLSKIVPKEIGYMEFFKKGK